MITVLEVLQKSAAFLESKQVEGGRLNAELLIGHALGLKRMQLYMEFERLVPEKELELIRPLIRRRGQREPLQYIIGTVDFSGVELKVDRRALIPRPETEYLVELINAEFASAGPKSVLDLGTGSGALALALATHWPEAQIWALDASADALALAEENRASLGLVERVRVLQSDWFSAVPRGEVFDLIVANPPYLTGSEVAEAAPEVREFEPGMALSTAADGLDAITAIIAGAPQYLRAGGLLAMETGIAQHPQICEMLAKAKFLNIRSRADLTGRDRFVFATQP
jgi:release factor glutamine methyltransferase